MNDWNWDKTKAKKMCFIQNFRGTRYTKEDVEEFLYAYKQQDIRSNR